MLRWQDAAFGFRHTTIALLAAVVFMACPRRKFSLPAEINSPGLSFRRHRNATRVHRRF